MNQTSGLPQIIKPVIAYILMSSNTPETPGKSRSFGRWQQLAYIFNMKVFICLSVIFWSCLQILTIVNKER